MKIFDSHAHYDDDRYDGIREELMEEMEKNGVDHIVNCGSSREGMRQKDSGGGRNRPRLLLGRQPIKGTADGSFKITG